MEPSPRRYPQVSGYGLIVSGAQFYQALGGVGEYSMLGLVQMAGDRHSDYWTFTILDNQINALSTGLWFFVGAVQSIEYGGVRGTEHFRVFRQNVLRELQTLFDRPPSELTFYDLTF